MNQECSFGRMSSRYARNLWRFPRNAKIKRRDIYIGPFPPFSARRPPFESTGLCSLDQGQPQKKTHVAYCCASAIRQYTSRMFLFPIEISPARRGPSTPLRKTLKCQALHHSPPPAICGLLPPIPPMPGYPPLIAGPPPPMAPPPNPPPPPIIPIIVINALDWDWDSRAALA